MSQDLTGLSSERVFCPECQKEGQKSVVYQGSSVTTAVHSQPFYDEAGRYHHHDPNTTTTSWTCSRGHKWATHDRRTCWCQVRPSDLSE